MATSAPLIVDCHLDLAWNQIGAVLADNALRFLTTHLPAGHS